MFIHRVLEILKFSTKFPDFPIYLKQKEKHGEQRYNTLNHLFFGEYPKEHPQLQLQIKDRAKDKQHL